MAHHSQRASGIHTLVVVLYIVLTLAALGRSGYQIATAFEEAPFAYSLSAVAAVIYLVATISLMGAKRRLYRQIATVAVSIEAAGVLLVGALSVLRPELFPEATVWSGFGQGYLFIPLVLPFVGLWWMRRVGATEEVGR